MRVSRTMFAFLAAFAITAFRVHAQDVANDAAPAHIAVVEGSATFYRENQSEPAGQGMPFVPGDRVRTERGRAEIVFPDGSVLDIDEFSTIELQDSTLIRLTDGRVLLLVAGANNPAAARKFQVDTPSGSAQTYGPGEYRISIAFGASGIQTELAVLRGSAALTNDQGTMALRAGERSAAWSDGPPTNPQPFNSARVDAFEQWASGLRGDRVGSRSAQYLPSDLRMYSGALDRGGAWEYDAPYGYVWYPSVQDGWRPYYDGYWASVPAYGWTWVGVDAWAWPTHHYGRWGYARSRWYWIPERRWSPAWVSWGAAPGYVSWCPLGFDNRPVFSLGVGVQNGYASWTVMPRDRFGIHDRNAHRFAVGARSLPSNLPFVQTGAPATAPRAVPRRIVGGAPAPAGVSGTHRGTVSASQSAFGRVAVPRSRAATPPSDPQQPQIAQPRNGAVTAPPTYRPFVEPYRQPEIIRGQPIPPTPPTPRAPAAPQAPPQWSIGVPRGPERAPSQPALPIYRARPVPPTPSAPTSGGSPQLSQPAVPIHRGRPVPPTPSAPPSSGPSQYGVGIGRGPHNGAQVIAPPPPPSASQPPARQERYQMAIPRSQERSSPAAGPGTHHAQPSGSQPGGQSQQYQYGRRHR